MNSTLAEERHTLYHAVWLLATTAAKHCRLQSSYKRRAWFSELSQLWLSSLVTQYQALVKEEYDAEYDRAGLFVYPSALSVLI